MVSRSLGLATGSSAAIFFWLCIAKFGRDGYSWPMGNDTSGFPLEKSQQEQPSSWAELFQAKKVREALLPWDDAYMLISSERLLIASSIQQFELGENSEGRSFRAAAVRYAEATGDWEYVSALELFIQEEQRHSRYLRRFMESQGLPRLRSHWVDDSFRWLRRLAGLEVFVMVLLIAEVIAVPYYKSLKAATRSPLLRAICEEILRDEAQHLRFQTEVLVKLRKERPTVCSRVVAMISSVLMIGTCAVVWQSHSNVLRCGGFTVCSLTRKCVRTMARLDRRSRRGSQR